MLTLARRKCIVICISLVWVVLVATSCVPAATPTPTPLPVPTFTQTMVVATPTPIPTATPVVATPAPIPTATSVATPTLAPTEAPTAAPTPKVVGTPTSPDEVPRISLQELKALMDSGADMVILDCQPRSVYEQGHIKGAISLPWAPELDEEDILMLPWGKPIITYCACGPGEGDSADVALQLIRMGFEDVKVLADPSIMGWMEAGYPME
jgi:rhodanese-related sulfurtransferase